MNEPLRDWVIVDLSSGIEGNYCTKLLADGGADVIKVEAPEGDPLRRWSASGAAPGDREDGALFRFLAASKRSIVADFTSPADVDDVLALIGSADAVVWTPSPRIADVARLRPSALHHEHPHLTVTSITPFGLDGPWRDRAATEFTLQAWSGGMIGLGRGDPTRAPVFVGGQIGSWLSGAHAAAGTLLSRLRLGPDRGEIVDVSTLEVLALCLTYFPVTYFDALGRPFRSRRSVVTPGVGTAMDGMIAVGVGTGQQWLDFCVMVGHSEWMEDTSLFRERGHLAPMIDEWFAAHTVDEIRELANAFRLPNAPIANGATLPLLEHFVQRRSFVSSPSGDFVHPAPPYRMHPARLRDFAPAPVLGGDRGYVPRSDPSAPPAGASSGGAPSVLEGLRVLDMTAFWAGPSCTQPLALLGAEVIHLESTGHLDGTRMLGAPLTEDQWWERSPIFSALNANKKSLALDFQSEQGMEVLRRLIATSDVVVENYTPRVLDQVGLSFEALREIRDDIIVVRMPGFGLDGPWRDNAAFAYTIEDASGLTWMTGYPDQRPLEPYCVGDPNAGVHALVGLLMALEHRRRTGEGVAIEAAMIDAAINVTAEQVIEYSAHGALLERAGNHGPGAAPQNLYRTNDLDERGGHDSWIAIAVTDDAQWDALVSVLGGPVWARVPALSSAAGRAANRYVIDEHLAEWCGRLEAETIVDLLSAAGIPVARVVQPHRQGDLAQLQARHFFEAVDHPVAGRARHSTLAMRFSGGPDRLHARHAPLLGEHNVELLRGVGLTDAAIAALEVEGVIGYQPARTGASAATG